MYFNLDTIPAGKAMFTLYVGVRGEALELTEERDEIASTVVPEKRHLAALVIEAARPILEVIYGSRVEARGLVNQSAGYVVFDSRVRGFRPIPVVPPTKVTETFDSPYDGLLDLMLDAHDGMGTGEYLDFLLGG